jgi:hypothetical protein
VRYKHYKHFFRDQKSLVIPKKRKKFLSSFQNYHKNQNQKHQSDTARSIGFKCSYSRANQREQYKARSNGIIHISSKFNNTSGSGNFYCFILFFYVLYFYYFILLLFYTFIVLYYCFLLFYCIIFT